MPAVTRASSFCSPSLYVVYFCLAALGLQALLQQNIITQLRAELEELKEGHAHSQRKITKLSVDSGQQKQQQIVENTMMQRQQLEIPDYVLMKSPPNLPSVRLSQEEEKKAASKRKIYGGVGDKLHLGGFTQRDQMGISENLWNWMMGPLAVKSMLDIGCGKGVSTEYFHRHGAQVLCVEGSHDAITQSLLPAENVVEHDFSRGPWWPENTYDIAW